MHLWFCLTDLLAFSFWQISQEDSRFEISFIFLSFSLKHCNWLLPWMGCQGTPERLKVRHCHQSWSSRPLPPPPCRSAQDPAIVSDRSNYPLQTEVRHWGLFQRLRTGASGRGTEIRHSGRRVICDLCQRSEKPEPEIGYLNPLQGPWNLSPGRLQR